LERLLDLIENSTATSDNYPYQFMPGPAKLGKKWREYQGIHNWEGLLYPLDENLSWEILRYGQFVDATYKSVDFDPSSPSYANALFTRSSFFKRAGIPETGYRLTLRQVLAVMARRLPSVKELDLYICVMLS
jgi:phospholipase A1